MSIEWGPEIRVDGVRPAWLADFTPALTPREKAMAVSETGTAVGEFVSGQLWREVAWVRLPADHFAYTVFAYNEKHGTDFYPWAGGDRAPYDWDGTDNVIIRNGDTGDDICVTDWDWLDEDYDIIGYTRRKAPQEAPQAPSDTGMTIGQALQLVHRHNGDHIAMLRELGMIRPDETEARIAAETGVKLADVSRVIAAYEGIKNG